ncbi:MAG: hypothetical protein K6L81_01755 [Agarilytica sp.]
MSISAEEFNELYPKGTPVILADDFGKEHQTNTRSEAWDLCGTLVVMVEGRSGGYDLSRLKPMETHNA